MSEIPTGLQAQLDALKAAQYGEPGQDQAPPTPADENAFQQQEMPIQDAPATQDPPAYTPTAQAMAEEGDWKRKHDAMFGRLSQEIGALRQQLAQERAERAKLEQVPATQPQPAQAQQKVSPDSISEETIRSLVSPEMIDDYGINFWRQHIALSQAAVLPVATNAADTRIRNVEAYVNSQAEKQFYAELSARVPDWKRINDSQQWSDFLGGIDPLTGYRYEAILNDAHGRFDALRVSAIFERFKQQAVAPSQRSAVPSIESQVSLPVKSAGGVPTQPKTMPFAQWQAELQGITSSGLSAQQALERQKELLAMYHQGRVTGAEAGASPPSSQW